MARLSVDFKTALRFLSPPSPQETDGLPFKVCWASPHFVPIVLQYGYYVLDDAQVLAIFLGFPSLQTQAHSVSASYCYIVFPTSPRLLILEFCLLSIILLNSICSGALLFFIWDD